MKVRGVYHALLTSIRGLLEEWELHPGGGGVLSQKKYGGVRLRIKSRTPNLVGNFSETCRPT